MFLVRNDDEFRLGYMILRCSRILPGYGATHAQRKNLADLKRSLRKYAHRNDSEYSPRVIKDYGVNGYITVRRMPDGLKDIEMARRFFGEFLTYQLTPSQYDCTGQRFTQWFKVVERRGSFWAYHSVGFDV